MRTCFAALLVYAGCFDPRVGPRMGPDAGSCGDGGCSIGEPCSEPTQCASGACRSGGCIAAEAPCPPAFAECMTYVDWTADAGSTIAFTGTRYSPRCIRVRLGQTVTFSGNFGDHPLRQACGPVAAIAAPATTFTSALGRYGFYCENHGSPSGTGMSGSIEVVP